MKRYFVKSFFGGWKEVSAERFDEFTTTLWNGSINIPYEEKEAFLPQRAVSINGCEIVEAVRRLGYNAETISVLPCGCNSFEVLLSGKYFGVWDCKRKTFVD